MTASRGIVSISAAGVLVPLMLAASACGYAQPVDALADCAEIENQSARLACYDGLLRREPAADAAAANAPQTNDTENTTEAETQSPNAASAERRQPREQRDRARRKRASESAAQNVVIVEVRSTFPNILIFETADGRTYAQTSTNAFRYRHPPFDALLEPASFGSYFLQPAGSNQRVRVSLRE